MSEKIELLSDEKITYEGIFDLKDLYKHAHDWLEWRKYDVAEKKYKEKIKPAGKDIEARWEATREIDEFSQFLIKVKWKVYALSKVEVQKEGGKLKMDRGEVNIFITAALVTDWQDKWEEKPITKFLKSFFQKYLYKGMIDKLKARIWKEGREFHNEIKAFLHLYRY